MITVPCYHCGAPVALDREPDGPVVCDPCAAEYEESVVAGMRRHWGDCAFSCERCHRPTLGDPAGSKLCDPCEDALHAEALEVTP